MLLDAAKRLTCRLCRQDHVDTTHYSDSEGIVSEEGIGEAELAELEELDAWIEAMVDLEEMERAHLMELALR